MKKSNVFIGRELYSCGACSVESILSYYGGYVPHETVLEDTYTTKTGTNAYNIVKALARYGFNAYGEKISLDKITKDLLPLIAYTTIDNYNHFLVIYEINDKRIVTMDPKWGIKNYSYAYFKSIFNDVVIIAKPVKKIVCMERKKTLKKLFLQKLKQNRKKILLLLNISILTIILGFVTSLFIKIAKADKIYFYIFIFILTIVFKWSLNYFKILYEEKLINRFKSEFINKIISQIFSLEKRYISNKRAGEIINKINDSTYIVDFLTKLVFSGTIDLIALLLGLILLFTFSYKMTLVIVLASSIYMLITILTSRKLYRREMEQIDSYNVYSGDLTEYIEGLESIKNLGFESNYINKLGASYNKYIDDSYRAYKFNAKTSFIKEMLLEVGYIISLGIALLNISNINTVYNIIIYASIYSIFENSLSSLTSYIPGYIHIKAIYKSTSEFLDLKHETSGSKNVDDFKTITINNLKYSYNHITDVIDIDHIKINKGDKILLIGASGKGKSTLAKCLSNYLLDYKGSILIDNIDIKDISLEKLKDLILYIGQDEKLFTDTILNNIAFGKYDKELFNKVIDVCELSDIINAKSEGENALILEGGINYSKGEKARLILARSLYKKPRVLIIDELLSSIPEGVEDKILNHILKDSNITLIYITHRNKKEYFNKVIDLRKDGLNEIK